MGQDAQSSGAALMILMGMIFCLGGIYMAIISVNYGSFATSGLKDAISKIFKVWRSVKKKGAMEASNQDVNLQRVSLGLVSFAAGFAVIIYAIVEAANGMKFF